MDYLKAPRAGCIVYRKSSNGIFFLALEQEKRYKGKTYIKLVSPKGMIDAGETSKQAALRETKEESGIKDIKYLCFLGEQNVIVKPNSFKIDWYLVESLSPDEACPQKEEGMIGFRWLHEKNALNSFSYKGFKPFVRKAYEILVLDKEKSAP